MHHHRVAFADAVEIVQRPAAGQHVVFGKQLEPVDARLALEDFLVVRSAQSEAEAQCWNGEWVCHSEGTEKCRALEREHPVQCKDISCGRNVLCTPFRSYS